MQVRSGCFEGMVLGILGRSEVQASDKTDMRAGIRMRVECYIVRGLAAPCMVAGERGCCTRAGISMRGSPLLV
jgi:hypothetical protein